MQAFKCPNCGGDLKYDAAGKVLSCAHCGTRLTQAEYRARHGADRRYRTNELICPQCGAAMLSYDDTIASFCGYCGSSVSFTKRIVEETKPDGIMPFSVTREQALELYREKISHSRFVPDWLQEEGEHKLVGIYMPYYSYSGTAEEHLVTEGKKPDDVRYGVKYVYELEFDLEERFSGQRFDAAEVFPDFLSETVDTFEDKPTGDARETDLPDENGKRRQPEGVKPFDPAYLAGYYADGGSVGQERYQEILEGLVAEDLRRQDLDQGNMSIDNNAEAPKVSIRAKKILYPVWLNTHRRGDRVCYSVINGQNGTVAAEIPVDKGKYLKWAVILAAAISVVLNQIWTVKPMPFLGISMALLFLTGLRLRVLAKNVYLRQAHLDDVGLNGQKKMMESAAVTRSDRLKWVPFAVGLTAFILLLTLQSANSSGKERFNEDFLFTVLMPPILLSVLAGLTAAVVTNSIVERNGITWSFTTVPGRVKLSAWWRPMLGLLISTVILLSETVHDEPYYIAGVINLAMAIWSAVDLIEAQNRLNTRPIPLFSRKRGGEPDA